MLRLEMHKENSKEVVYNYFPEHEKDSGTLLINKDNGKISVIEVAKSDQFNRYLHHAVARLEKYYESKKYLKNDTIAWY